MSSNLLLVCHSTGDTNACLALAKKRIEQDNKNMHFLVVGQAAKRILDKNELIINNKIHVSFLSDILDIETMQRVENDALNEIEIAQVKQFLLDEQINKAFIGTPSLLNAKVPFQIAECIAEHLESGAIFNDYLFEEKQHEYWKQVQSKQKWLTKFAWLMPLPMAAEKLKKANADLTVSVVGHPIFDGLQVRKELQIADTSALIFISGTKELADDRVLLADMLDALNEREDLDIEIRWGLHPGTANISEYVSGLIEEVQSYTAFPIANKFKFILTDADAKKFNPPESQEKWFIRKNINGDTAAAAADGVACSVPATLVNKAVLERVPAYYHQTEKEPYLPTKALQVGKANLNRFFTRVTEDKQPQPLTRTELGLPDDKDFGEMVVRKMGLTQ